ncbi:hypothetical protein ACRAWG_16975 [Methylobacterium sp. P31]
MHGVSVRAAAETEQVEAGDDARPLNLVEQALRTALTDELMSTSVVRERARQQMAEISPSLDRTMLSRDLPVATTHSAFHELERRGLAKQIVFGGHVRWRRRREAGDESEGQPPV